MKTWIQFHDVDPNGWPERQALVRKVADDVFEAFTWTRLGDDKTLDTTEPWKSLNEAQSRAERMLVEQGHECRSKKTCPGGWWPPAGA